MPADRASYAVRQDIGLPACFISTSRSVVTRFLVVFACDIANSCETSGKDSRHRLSLHYLSGMFSPVVSVKRLEVTVPTGRRVLFVSDVHLGLGAQEADRQRESVLLQLLSQAAENAAHVFIVGDLFDYWFDYKHVVPHKHIRTLAALAHLRGDGVPITYLMGNHDFGHRSYFQGELGIEVEQGDVAATINGKRFYISHGDGKAANDRGYLLLRAILRSKAAQWLYRGLHPDIGIGLAARTSHSSRTYTDAKEYGSDGLRTFASERIAEGYDVVVMGHRHKAVEERINNGLYINLGDWLGATATYGEFFPPGEPSLKTVQVYLPTTTFKERT